jgi:hypothetical protein
MNEGIKERKGKEEKKSISTPLHIGVSSIEASANPFSLFYCLLPFMAASVIP